MHAYRVVRKPWGSVLELYAGGTVTDKPMIPEPSKYSVCVYVECTDISVLAGVRAYVHEYTFFCQVGGFIAS